jgi:hypothetical protein
MNATPLLAGLPAALAQELLEAVLIGNAAAAIHGAPVTAPRKKSSRNKRPS